MPIEHSMKSVLSIALVVTLALPIGGLGHTRANAFAPQRAAADVFICPMHPDVRGANPGTCPRCGMRLVPAAVETAGTYVLEIETNPAPLKADQRTRLQLRVRHPASDEPVRRFVEVHEKLFHLFVVSHDLQHFEHVHPTFTTDGSFEIDVKLPRAGAYQLYADFLPEGGTPQLLQRTLLTAGFIGDPENARARLQPDLAEKSDRGIIVTLQLSAGDGLIAGRQEMFRLRLRDAASGAPVTDLQPFLGASGHALIISHDLVDAIHSHPVVEFSKPNGPDIVFDAVFPRPGLYKLWAQFQRRGQVAVVSFTLPVSERP